MLRGGGPLCRVIRKRSSPRVPALLNPPRGGAACWPLFRRPAPSGTPGAQSPRKMPSLALWPEYRPGVGPPPNPPVGGVSPRLAAGPRVDPPPAPPVGGLSLPAVAEVPRCRGIPSRRIAPPAPPWGVQAAGPPGRCCGWLPRFSPPPPPFLGGRFNPNRKGLGPDTNPAQPTAGIALTCLPFSMQGHFRDRRCTFGSR